MRKAITCIVLAAACSSTTTDAPNETDPSCAEDEAMSARSEPLAWDLDRDPVSDTPICPADNPDCDGIDEDAPLDDERLMLESDLSTYALTDPLTSAGKYRAWPSGRIPYVLAKTNGVVQINAATRKALSQAMTNWEQLTEGRIKFRAKQASDKAYVIVKQGSPRVSPFVGYRKDQVQTLYLRDTEYLTVTKHELGHVIGLHHEQRRTDRLSYIKVRNQYIVNSDTCRYQFATCTTCKPIGTYDRNSVMHYRTHDLPGCRTGSVLLKLDGSAISHIWKVSPKDLTAVAKMYAKPQPPQPPPPGPPHMHYSGNIVSGNLCAAVDDGNQLELAACDGAGDQDWRLTVSGQLRVQESLQCAAVIGCSAAGAVVEQSACSDTAPDQKWSFEAMALVHGTSGTCVAASGTALATAACSGDASQQFDVRTETETIEIDGQCVTAGEAKVTLAACDGSASQQWMQARGGFVPRSNTAQCMGVAAGALALADCTDADDQRWALRGEIRDGRADLCLQGEPAAGSKLALATCDGSASQQFMLWSR